MTRYHIGYGYGLLFLPQISKHQVGSACNKFSIYINPTCRGQNMTQTIIRTLKRSLSRSKGNYDLKCEDVSTPSGILQTRYIFCILVFFGKFFAFFDRMLLNVAIVGMVDHDTSHHSKLQIWVLFAKTHIILGVVTQRREKNNVWQVVW